MYKAIAPLGISDEIVYIDPLSGIKISRYYPDAHIIADDDWESIKAGMKLLRRLHTSDIYVSHNFDIEKKLVRYEDMCRSAGILNQELETKAALQRILETIRSAQEPKSLCHMDCVNINFLKCRDGTIRLLDWEYSGMCHSVADIAMFCVFSGYEPYQYDQLLDWYYNRQPTESERLLCFCYAAAGGMLWYMWALYRQHFGENFGTYSDRMCKTALFFSDYVAQLCNNKFLF